MESIGLLARISLRLLEVVKDDEKAYLVFEYLDCDLKNFMKNRPTLFQKNPELLKRFLYQILSGLDHCHAHQILHLDLKPSNILVDKEKYIVKLADFGLSRIDSPPPRTPENQVAATLCYRAPEFIADPTSYSTAADIWSVGCIFAEMLIQRPLFGDTLHCNVVQSIFRTMGNPDARIWPEATSLFRHINCFSAVDPPNLEDMFPGLEPLGFDLLTKMLCVHPTGRITASDALDHAYFKPKQSVVANSYE